MNISQLSLLSVEPLDRMHTCIFSTILYDMPWEDKCGLSHYINAKRCTDWTYRNMLYKKMYEYVKIPVKSLNTIRYVLSSYVTKGPYKKQ